ncbi:MAG: hypothetical protein E6H75_07465 [Betaproteobacteria bacterium]|nr:MAG: hypothetical protein E6H75_07465 [Betaproteobacteria bacterium]TMG77685.1 MAG: hypothetical protein E6H80_00565 [Betaproteobacteria bacterium]
MRVEFSIGDIANPLIDMAENDPDKLKGPGGSTLRQIHEQVQKSVTRDREAQKMKNQLAQKPSRWQRFVRYVWDKKRG